MADVLAGLSGGVPPRCTIAWDVDDVLNDLTREWLEDGWRAAHPGCAVRYEDLTANPPHEALGAAAEAYHASLDAFRLARLAELAPSAEVLAWLSRHGGEFRHLALTATTREVAPLSAAWVMRHFGDWVRAYVLVPSTRPTDRHPTYDRTKGDALRWLGMVDVLVDDSPANVEAARAAGCDAVLMPRPWNAARRSTADALNELLVVARRPRPAARAPRPSPLAPASP